MSATTKPSSEESEEEEEELGSSSATDALIGRLLVEDASPSEDEFTGSSVTEEDGTAIAIPMSIEEAEKREDILTKLALFESLAEPGHSNEESAKRLLIQDLYQEAAEPHTVEEPRAA